VKRRIYLTLERGRDLCLRNLLRKVCREQKWEDDGKIRKVGLGEFVAAVGVSEGGGKVERDEVECLLAIMIYKVCSISPVIYFSLALLCLSLMLGDTAQRCPRVGSLAASSGITLPTLSSHPTHAFPAPHSSPYLIH